MSITRCGAFAVGFATLFSASAWAAEAPAPGLGNRPMFARQPGLRPNVIQKLATPNWTFGYTYQGTKYSEMFIGTNPAQGASSTIPVYIIPLKMVLGTTSFSPLSKLGNGLTVVQNTVASPIFQSNVDFVQGGTDVGTTQFTDAFQRVNLWGKVASHPGYHVLLGGPTVKPEQTLVVPAADGVVATAFGTKVIEASINWFDGQIQPLIAKLKIPVNALPVFMTTQTYLLQGAKSGCCIGGYHSFNGTQAYSHFTYIQTAGAFSQDVSALSHELAEWMDDPETSNNSACGIYEVGDPLEGGPNYGGFPYVVNGFTYNLQDEVTPVYFGAPVGTSLHGKATFQGATLSVCSNGA